MAKTPLEDFLFLNIAEILFIIFLVSIEFKVVGLKSNVYKFCLFSKFFFDNFLFLAVVYKLTFLRI